MFCNNVCINVHLNYLMSLCFDNSEIMTMKKIKTACFVSSVCSSQIKSLKIQHLWFTTLLSPLLLWSEFQEQKD